MGPFEAEQPGESRCEREIESSGLGMFRVEHLLAIQVPMPSKPPRARFWRSGGGEAGRCGNH